MCKITPHLGFSYSSVFSVSVVVSCTTKKTQEQHNTLHLHASLLRPVDIAATTQYKLTDLMSQLFFAYLSTAYVSLLITDVLYWGRGKSPATFGII